MASTERPPSIADDATPTPRPVVVRSHRSSNGGIAGFLTDASRRMWSGSAHRWVVRAFTALQELGINVTPNHFYWPIPDLRVLRRRRWPEPTLPSGVEFNLPRHVEFLKGTLSAYLNECSFPEEPGPEPYAFHFNNGLFESVDAEIAYCMVRHFKPRRIVEIGGGFSTRLLATAVLENCKQTGTVCELTTIEPFPDRLLTKGFPGLSRLITKRVQEVPLNFFTCLNENDILFVDSSHVVGIGGDVCFEILNILPELHKGVVVHFHDIFLPFDYPEQTVLQNLCFWTEQYLLQAFLAFNREFEVIWGSSAMQLFHRGVLASAFPNWRYSYARLPRAQQQLVPTFDRERVWPSSFWIRRLK